MGIAELDIPLGGGALTDRISHRIDSRLGLRRYATRDSRNVDDICARSPPSPQFNNADCDWSGCFGGGMFLLLPRASARKIDKSIAVLPFQNLSDLCDFAFRCAAED